MGPGGDLPPADSVRSKAHNEAAARQSQTRIETLQVGHATVGVVGSLEQADVIASRQRCLSFSHIVALDPKSAVITTA